MTAAQYAAKKAAGLCVESGCRRACTGATVWCTEHEAMHAAKRVGAYDSDEYRRWQRERQRRFRRDREAAGLCVRCNQPAVTRQLCRRHQLEALAKQRARKPPGKRQTRCSHCHEVGHRITTCPARYAMMVVDAAGGASAPAGGGA